MARVRPFSALRYAPSSGEISRRLGHPSQLADPELRARALADPLHALQLADAPNPAGMIDRWLEAGQLVRDESPAMYVLEIQQVSNSVLPRRAPVHLLLCTLDPEAFLPLEEEAPTVGGPGQAPALSLAADDHGVLRELLAEVTRGRPPETEVRAEGALLRLWRIDEAGWLRRAEGVLAEAPVRPLGALPTDAPAFAAVLPLSEPGLRLTPVHRALRGLPNFQRDTFLALVAKYARVYDLELPLRSSQGLAAAIERLGSMTTGQHAVLLVLPDGEGKVLRFRQGLELDHIRAAPRNPTLRSLDLALLNALVLQTVLGIQEPQRLGHPNVFPVAGLENLIAQVDGGTFQVGFALNPPPVWEVRAVIEAHQVLPPRTLALEPMPPAGLVFTGQ